MTEPRQGRQSERGPGSSGGPPASVVLLQAIDPLRAWVGWLVDAREVEAARCRAAMPRAEVVLRLHFEAGAGTPAAPPPIDLPVGAVSGSQYVQLPAPALTVTAELGVRAAQCGLEPILRSNSISLPPGAEAADSEPRSRRVRGTGDPLWQPRRRPAPLPWAPAEAVVVPGAAAAPATAAPAATSPAARVEEPSPGRADAPAPATSPGAAGPWSSYGRQRQPPGAAAAEEESTP